MSSRVTMRTWCGGKTWAIVLIGLSVAFADRASGECNIFVAADSICMSNCGGSWDDAYKSLSTALSNAASSQDICIKHGAYMPDGIGRDATFVLKDGVGVFGGFAGVLSETNESNRFFGHCSGGTNDGDGCDVDDTACLAGGGSCIVNESVLSGDLDSDDVYCDDEDSCTNTCNGLWKIAICDTIKNNDENAFHVVTYKNAGMSDVILDGFTVRGGNADGMDKGNYDLQGAGIQIREIVGTCIGGAMPGAPCANDFDCFGRPFGTCQTSSPICLEGGPTIRNCIIERNHSDAHGAINDHSITGVGFPGTSIENCIFRDNFARVRGAALNIQDGSTSVTGSMFYRNVVVAKGLEEVAQGGAVWTAHTDDTTCGDPSEPVFSDCVFTDNHVTVGAVQGGAMFNLDNNPTVERCTFRANTASKNGAGGNGGGAMWNENGKATIRDCLVEENLALGQGGGGFYNKSVDGGTTVVNCKFIKNQAFFGGGNYNNIASADGPDYFNCSFIENVAGFGGGTYEEDEVKYTNCLFWRNDGGSSGGGVISTNSTQTFVNCTFVENIASAGGGIGRLNSNGAQIVENCIFWGNTSSLNGGSTNENDQIEIFTAPAVPAVVNNSILHNCGASYCGSGSTNCSDDPLFRDADGPDGDASTFLDNDYRLSDSSPAIDAGDNTVLTDDLGDLDDDGITNEIIPFDLGFVDRQIDDPLVDATTTCNSNSTPIDMGAYEAGVCTIAESVAPEDVAVLKNRYLSFKTQNVGNQVAIRVTMISTNLGSAYQAFVGQSWWVQAYDSADVVDIHRLDCTPVYQSWPTQVIHVADGVIFPESTYVVEVVNQDCCPGNPPTECAPTSAVYSTPFIVNTSSVWGDIVGDKVSDVWEAPDGVVDQNDLDAVLEALTLEPTAPPVTWADVSGSVPDTDVGISDLIAISNAVNGAIFPYPASDPCGN